MEDQIIHGTDLAINVSFSVDGVAMQELDFICEFTIGGVVSSVPKSKMVKVDANNYIAPIKAANTRAGSIEVKVIASVPDTRFPDGKRTEVGKYTIPSIIVK